MTTNVANIPNVAIVETDVLSSWKEIAAYLGRGVRTAQRWEAELQMPVYRPWGKDHSAVIAMKSEIDRWIKSRSYEKRAQQIAVVQVASSAAPRRRLENDVCSELVARSRDLRADVVRNREMLRDSIESLWKTLSSMNGADREESF